MSNKNKAAGRMPALPASTPLARSYTPDESWRLFISIELPATVRKALKDHLDCLKRVLPNIRASWTREENFHLTLKFLGDTRVTKVELLSQATERAAHTVSPFELVIGGCGAFPTHGQPRVLWIGIHDPSAQLETYNRALENECAQAGFPREPRPFHPHLTVARLRQPAGARGLADLHK